jgi:hypothetical protein
LALRDFLLNEINKDQQALKDALAFKPVEDYATYREMVGEIRGLQRVIRLIEDLPDE